MMRIGIVGYGNLGRGAEAAVNNNEDMELVAVFTRRDPETVHIAEKSVPVVSYSRLAEYTDKIDVIILCGGSATDLPEMTPEIAKNFNVVDSFDTHAKIADHYIAVNEAAKESEKVAVISAGWDPGLFSLARLFMSSVVPDGKSYTFWGRGVSQGHSDAIRRIDGVIDARQYTDPVPETMEKIRNGETPDLTPRQMHKRECYVVAEDGADKERITREIKEMPNYFSDYDTTVTFITQEEMDRDHSELPHGGYVLRSGHTGADGEYSDTMEFSLKLDSNPYFTGSVLAACARAAYKLNQAGHTGCMTMFDIPPALYAPYSGEQLTRTLL
jgi:diaminopimelate dehydrogenase